MSRERVYALLNEHPGEFLSGEAVSAQLGVSRAAVWKAIEARTGLGYRLTAPADLLTEEAVRRCFRPGTVCGDLRCLETVDSTNSYLKREALLGAPDRTVAAASAQTAGRGRVGRTFQSPAGRGVYLSVLLRPRVPAEALLSATGMAAVAVSRAVERAAGVRPLIKWTNDLVLNGRKLCGILTELAVEGETGMTQSLVIGAGVNVSHTPEDFGPEVAQMATSLAQEGFAASRAQLAAAMIEELRNLSDALGGDVSPWVEAYRRDCVTLGRPVRLLWSDRQEQGHALDIDDQFGLIVRLPDGSETTIRTGEVSVRGLYGYTE